MSNRPKRSLVDWAIAERPIPGEAESGDRAVVVAQDDVALVAAVDGLGHGPAAARAAAPVVETLRGFAREPLVSLAERCHDALRQHRGAALSIARFCGRDDSMSWVGVGNVAGRLVRGDIGGTVSVQSLLQARGIVGDNLPALEPAILDVRRGDLLLLATDGIDPGFVESLRPYGTTDELATRILADHSNPRDDALVVVARYIGRAR